MMLIGSGTVVGEASTSGPGVKSRLASMVGVRRCWGSLSIGRGVVNVSATRSTVSGQD